MLNRNKLIRFIIPCIITIAVLVTGCTEKKPVYSDLKAGVALKYNLPADKVLNYKNSSSTTQSIEAMGQSAKTTLKAVLDYGIKGKGTEAENLLAEVIISNISITVNSPQGSVSPNTSALNGKSFDISISTKGKDVKFTGIENLPKLRLSAQASGEQSAKSLFENILPVLPDNPVKSGDTWTVDIDKTTEQGPVKISVKGTTTNTFEGIETVDGMECIKFKTDSKSTADGTGKIQGQDMTIKGDIKLTGTWYFAYKEGIFVKSSSDESAKMKMTVGGMMEIPQTITSKTTIELAK